MTNFISFEAEFENGISEKLRRLRQQQQAYSWLTIIFATKKSKTLTDCKLIPITPRLP